MNARPAHGCTNASAHSTRMFCHECQASAWMHECHAGSAMNASVQRYVPVKWVSVINQSRHT
eukprot:1145236-Pelagomonas_calceolata.AAC.1